MTHPQFSIVINSRKLLGLLHFTRLPAVLCLPTFVLWLLAFDLRPRSSVFRLPSSDRRPPPCLSPEPVKSEWNFLICISLRIPASSSVHTALSGTSGSALASASGKRVLQLPCRIRCLRLKRDRGKSSGPIAGKAPLARLSLPEATGRGDPEPESVRFRSVSGGWAVFCSLTLNHDPAAARGIPAYFALFAFFGWFQLLMQS